MEKLYVNPKIVVIVPEKYVLYEPTIDRNKLFCSNEILFKYQLSMRTRYDFHLMPRMEVILSQLIEAGLDTKWEIFQIYENGWINVNSSALTGMKINDKHGYDRIEENADGLVSLNLDHIGGAIFIFVLGQIIAFAVFIFEIILTNFC